MALEVPSGTGEAGGLLSNCCMEDQEESRRSVGREEGTEPGF